MDTDKTASNYLSLGPLSIEEVKDTDLLIGTGKMSYMGGWDKKKGFHKDMIPYYPPGSVFSKKININCIAFTEGK